MIVAGCDVLRSVHETVHEAGSKHFCGKRTALCSQLLGICQLWILIILDDRVEVTLRTFEPPVSIQEPGCHDQQKHTPHRNRSVVQRSGVEGYITGKLKRTVMRPTQITATQPTVTLTQRGPKFTGPGVNVFRATVIRISAGKTYEMYNASVVNENVAWKATRLPKDCYNQQTCEVSRCHPLQLYKPVTLFNT